MTTINKEEILARSRKENKDELVISVRDKSMKWTYLVMVLAAAVFAFLRAQRGESITDLYVTVCASCAAGQLYRFFGTKDRGYLVLGIISAAMAAFGIVRYIMGY